ncbi:MAG TPA: DUF1592 domain-containing protein [Polyangiaceae bacterium]|jgi:hypothetical protein|nr:DUF1592 domain-containing protein [Polyangiaceae bacterium]
MHHKMHARALLAGLPLLALAAACSGAANGGGDSPGASGSGNNPPGSSGGSTGVPGGGQNSGSSAAPGVTTGGAGNGTTSGGSSTAQGGSGQTATGGSTAGGANAVTCPAPDVVPTPLRRLTRFEYANTVKALLNVDPAPASDLPADEASDGFSNNAGVLTVSSLHAEKYVLVSEALAKAAVANLTALTGCDAAAKGEDACQQAFARSFGRRAFRRPTTAQDEQMFKAAYDAGRSGGSYAEGIEVMIRAALQSPDFLYRLETTTPADASTKLVPLSQYELATRLSFMVWATGPDDALLDAASRGELATKAQVAAKVRSMLGDPKARVAITQFYSEWMGTSRLGITTKNTTLFPAFTAPLQDAMAKELPAFVEYVLWSGDHKLNTLLTSQNAFVSGPLAQLYGVTAPAGGGAVPQMVTLPAAQGRSGLLTQAGFLSVQAHPDQTSPVLRGKFVLSRLLCTPPPPPPPDVNVTPPDTSKAATARERLAAHEAAGASCASCHQLMDPIGLAFENFDGLGQYRTTEGGKTIDVSGEFKGSSDPSLSGAFKGVREMAVKLAGSTQVRDCVATHWFRYASGRNEDNGDTCSLRTVRETFGSSDADLVELIVATTQADTFWFRSPIVR